MSQYLQQQGTNCENQSSPTNSINNISCVSDNFQKQLDMLAPYQLENLTSLVDGDLVLLERKYRAIPNLELWESLIGMCLLNCYDEMVRDLGETSYEDRHTTNESEKIRKSGSLLARMRRHVTFTPDTVFENQRTSKEYRTFTKHQRRLLRQSTSTNQFGTILFEMNNWQYSHLSLLPSRRVVIRPGNYT